MRAFSYISKPSTQWQSLLTEVTSTTMYLMSRNGPTVFKIKDDNDTDDRTYKVTLGNPHKCSCRESGGELCRHILYCLVKVLRVSREHPLCYQSCLTDPELDMVLSGQCSGYSGRRNPLNRVHRPALPNENQSTRKEEKSPKREEDTSKYVTRQPLLDVTTEEEENTCPICQDNMDKAKHKITWCRHGCGNNIHAVCMMKYAEHKKQKDQESTCPLCRELWDMALLKLDLKEDPVGKESDGKKAVDKFAKYRSTRCNTVKCSYCKCVVRRLFHRCIECSQQTYQFYHKEVQAITQLPLNEMPLQATTKLASKSDPVDFCHDCFQPHRLSSTHQTHHFLTSDASIEFLTEVTWLSCSNPLQAAVLQQQRAAALQSLQGRDLTVNDYDLLLSLDQSPAAVDISVLLISSFPKATVGNCWCNKTISFPVMQPLGAGSSSGDGSTSTTMISEELLSLPCQHCVHKSCLQQRVDEILNQRYASANSPSDSHVTNPLISATSSSSQSSSTLDSGDIMLQLMFCRCDHSNCKKLLFGALQRKKRSPPKANENVNTNSIANNVINGKVETGGKIGGLRSLSANHATMLQQSLQPQGLMGIGIGGVGLPPLHPSSGGGVYPHLTSSNASNRLPSLHMAMNVSADMSVGSNNNVVTTAGHTMRRNNSVPTFRDRYDQFILDPQSLLNVGVNSNPQPGVTSSLERPPVGLGRLRSRTSAAVNHAHNVRHPPSSLSSGFASDNNVDLNVVPMGHPRSNSFDNGSVLPTVGRRSMASESGPPTTTAAATIQNARNRMTRALQAVETRFENTPSLEVAATSIQSHLPSSEPSVRDAPLQPLGSARSQRSTLSSSQVSNDGSNKNKSNRRIFRINTFRPTPVMSEGADQQSQQNPQLGNLDLLVNVHHYDSH
jgi:hypothetical protein